jgi:protein regulator of cytokinesis 1
MDTSYLAQQVTTIIGQLHGLFDEIGVPSHERDSREAEVRDLRITLYHDANMSTALLCIVRNLAQPAATSHK